MLLESSHVRVTNISRRRKTRQINKNKADSNCQLFNKRLMSCASPVPLGITKTSHWKYDQKQKISNVVSKVSHINIFWYVKSYSLVVHRWLRGTYLLHLQDRNSFPCVLLATCMTHSSTLKTETIQSSETWVNFYRTTRRQFLKHGTIQKISNCHGDSIPMLILLSPWRH